MPSLLRAWTKEVPVFSNFFLASTAIRLRHTTTGFRGGERGLRHNASPPTPPGESLPKHRTRSSANIKVLHSSGRCVGQGCIGLSVFRPGCMRTGLEMRARGSGERAARRWGRWRCAGLPPRAHSAPALPGCPARSSRPGPPASRCHCRARCSWHIGAAKSLRSGIGLNERMLRCGQCRRSPHLQQLSTPRCPCD